MSKLLALTAEWPTHARVHVLYETFKKINTKLLMTQINLQREDIGRHHTSCGDGIAGVLDFSSGAAARRLFFNGIAG